MIVVKGEWRDLRRRYVPMCGRDAIGGKTHAKCMRAWGMDGLVSIWRYDGVARKAIKKLKFRLVTDVVDEMMAVLMDDLENNSWVGEFFERGEYLVVPVPLYSSRERWRGFNQAVVMGERLAVGLGIEFDNKIIKRIRNTKSQAEMKVELGEKEKRIIAKESVSKLDFEERRWNAVKKEKLRKRLENVKGAFRVRKKLEGRNVLLVDDVWTSGATMREGAKVLKRGGAGRVWGFTVAR